MPLSLYDNTMTILKILDYPDPRLKTIAPTVEDVQDATIQKMIDDMLETLEKTPYCGGLATTQLDIKHPKRIFVFYDSNESQLNATVAINPEIIATEGKQREHEGCMSVYCDHIRVKVERPLRCTIRTLDRQGKTLEMEREHYLASLFCHEIDHLNGKICIDHLQPLKRKLIDKKISKIRRKLAQQ